MLAWAFRNQPALRFGMSRALTLLLLALLISSAEAVDQAHPIKFDVKPLLEDFHQILVEMSAHYSNLEWAIEDRRMNLPRLRTETEAKLRDAEDEAGGRRILEQFLASFGDGHLEIRWPKADSSANSGTATQGICARLGYNNPLRLGLDFSKFDEFSALDTPEAKLFSGGVLRLDNHTIIGILRIGLFSEHAYPPVCQEAVENLHLHDDAPCDEKCEDQIEIATADLLTASLVNRAEALRSAGATRLLIDITHNGGGSDWVDAVPRALSAIPLHESKMGFIKHAHWTDQLQERLSSIQTDIDRHANSPISLNAAATTLQKAIEESRRPCDRIMVWDTGKLDCSLLVKNLLFASGIVDYAAPGSLGSLASKTVIFKPSAYAYTENPKSLPLDILVDRNTWSAAEYFAALLQDNHAATIIGELTGGAGCGYTNGGIPTRLKNSYAQLKMPDCVRYRADGSNEVNGVTPDILLPWSGHDSDFQRVTKLLAVLRQQKNY